MATASRGVDPDCRRRRGAVLRLAAARESLDDDHAAAAVREWTRQRGLFERSFGRLGLFWAARRQGEQLARVRNVSGSIAVGEQPIDSMEALRQHVDFRKRRMNSSVASVIIL